VTTSIRFFLPHDYKLRTHKKPNVNNKYFDVIFSIHYKADDVISNVVSNV